MRVTGTNGIATFDFSEDYHDNAETAEYVARRLEESGYSDIVISPNEEASQ